MVIVTVRVIIMVILAVIISQFWKHYTTLSPVDPSLGYVHSCRNVMQEIEYCKKRQGPDIPKPFKLSVQKTYVEPKCRLRSILLRSYLENRKGLSGCVVL